MSFASTPTLQNDRVRLEPLSPDHAEDLVTVVSDGDLWGIAKQLEGLLADVGQLSKTPLGGIRMLASNREIHLQSVTWQEILSAPAGNPPALADFQRDAYGVTVPKRALFLGVRLVGSLMGKSDGKSVFGTMEELVKRSLAEDVPEIDIYKDDLQRLDRIFNLHDAKLPDHEEYKQLESWFNQGMGSDVLIEEQADRLIVADSAPMQFSAARAFDNSQMQSPVDQWLMDTLSHSGDAPHVISVRAELEPPKSTRDRARMSQRRIQANIEEEESSGDIEKVENSDTYQLVKEFEDYLSNERRPMLANCSILMAAEITDEAETYMDFLDNAYGIQMTTLEHRQILALDETLPTSNTRVNPFLQDVNVPMLSHAGLQAFSALGDDKGCFVGFIDPDGAPLFIDPSASSKQNLPPAFGVFGDPGSGKSSPVDTRVFVPGGVTTMGNLRPGDYVMGLEGAMTRVDSIHPQGVLDTYLVTLADGRQLRTSGTHLWNVRNLHDSEDAWANLELETFKDELFSEGHTAQWEVPVPRPLEHDEAEFLVDPYVVGTSAADRTRNWNDTADATISDAYLIGSIPQREALLQGVMDIAGGVSNDGFLVASRLSDEVAGKVRELVWSLGGVVFMEGLSGNRHVVMELPEDITPFRNAPTPEYNRSGMYMFTLPIVSVEKVEEAEHVCITVNSDDHLYVSGDYVVTHNTFFAQNFATQCVLYGMPVFFINPKAADSLDGLCDYINQSDNAATASKTSMMKAEEEPGAFDPFRFANDRLYAAEVAGIHLLAALDLPHSPLERDYRLSLQSGLRRGAEEGAKCVWDALTYIANEDHRTYLMNIIDQQMQASSLFALGVAKKPLPRLNMMKNHLTLVHFDREIGLPQSTDKSQYSVSERIALAAINLVTKAALEILIANRGGVLILDEAWTFLGQEESLQSLNRISREGRSLNIVPIFLTQKIKDVITSSLEDFMSRVLVLKLNSADEARAAFRVCGLKATKERLALLRDAGPKPPKNGKPAVWAQGMFRDLSFRHSWVALGPTPEEAMKAWSTNPEDKARAEAERKARLEAEQENAAAAAAASPATPEELLDSMESQIPTGALAAPAFNLTPDPETVPESTQDSEPEEVSEPAATPKAEPRKRVVAVEPEEDERPAPVKSVFSKPVAPWQKPDTEEETTSREEASAPEWNTPEEQKAPAPAFSKPVPAWKKHDDREAAAEQSWSKPVN
ncbi:MAG: ATP-binding protein [Microbacterium gubbeenense]|uniref:ATP-binding protein n=1 Tax=Microbacterium gubbeenense TaxID=159896 RepID=UPI003F998A16